MSAAGPGQVCYHGVAYDTIVVQPVLYTLASGASAETTWTFKNNYGKSVWLQALALAPLVTAGEDTPEVTVTVADREWTVTQSTEGPLQLTEAPLTLMLPFQFQAGYSNQEIEIPNQEEVSITIVNFGSSPAVGDVAIAIVVAYGE